MNFLTEIAVELSARDEQFLDKNLHFILELKLDDGPVWQTNLLSRESCTSVWDAKECLILPGIAVHFTLSVFIGLNGEERQSVASKKLYGPDVYNKPGELHEILLDGHGNHPDMILKTKILEADLFMEASGENSDDISNVIARQQEAVNLAEDDCPDKASLLNELGNSLVTRFERLGNLDDIDHAIENHQEAVNITPDNHSDKPDFLNDLGTSLFSRFQRLENLDDIRCATSKLQSAVDLTPDGHLDKPILLNTLGIFLLTQFQRLGNHGDVDNSIERHQEAATLTTDDHPHKSTLLSNLGNSLLARFECLGNLNDINNAILQYQAAVDLTPDNQPQKPSLLENLGNSLLTRFGRLGKLDDLENSILRLQAAVDLAPDDHLDMPSLLNDLGSSLLSRFERLGNLNDINNAISRHQEAVSLTPDGHPYWSIRSNNFGISLRARFERLGNLDDVHDAIKQLQTAVDLTLDNHPDKLALLNNLGSFLLTRFQHLGNLEDLDNAIADLQLAVGLTPDGHSQKPELLSNLGSSLRIRFQRLGNLDDINRAVARHQEAVNLTPNDYPNEHGLLKNLGNSLLSRFERLKNPDDLDNAIARYQEAVNLTPDDHPDKPSQLSSLGNSFLTRFTHLKNNNDIDNSIINHQAAVNLTPDDHPTKPTHLSSLGNSFLARFQRLNDLGDIDNAITRHQAAVNITPDDHPNRPILLNSLGSSLLTRFQHLGDPQDADTCVAELSSSSLSPLGSPSVRLIAARNWIDAASLINHASLLAACESAISIIPLVVWLGLSITDRHQHLAQIGDIVRKVAAIAISLGQCDKALEWLEQGRSIVWTQILQLRTPVDELRAVQPDLADRLLHVSLLLDQDNQDFDLRKDHRGSPEEEARQYRALARERDEIVEKIRSLHRFRDFLMPPKLHRLIEAAKEGPVVVINVSEKRCDALALVYGNDEAIHIPLPDLTFKRIIKLQSELRSLLKSSGVRLRAVRDSEVDVGGDEGCKRILAELWDHLVKPVLDSLAFGHGPDTLPRIWWCVTGQLSFLPIHAAGVYDTGDFSEQIQDYAISSYAPTISALLEQADAPAQKPFRLLSAVEPSSGPSYIPNTEKELEYIRRRLQNRDHVVLHKVQATKEQVIKEMRDCNWLHLACHGTQNATNPTKSALLLHGGKLTLEEIIRLNLPHAEFAFLSACQTMTGDEGLSDEAVHIAGGMSLAGYRSVVATMWSIEDALAPKVADEFYARLLQDGERPDNRKAAEALHFSVKKLREEEKDLKMLSWLPFVHLGI